MNSLLDSTAQSNISLQLLGLIASATKVGAADRMSRTFFEIKCHRYCLNNAPFIAIVKALGLIGLVNMPVCRYLLKLLHMTATPFELAELAKLMN